MAKPSESLQVSGARRDAPGRRAPKPVAQRVARLGVYAVSLLTGALLWEVVGRFSDPLFFVPLSATLETLWAMTAGGVLPSALWDSLLLFATGLSAGILVGLPTGLLLARVRFLRVGLEDWVTALYAMPMVALIPFILAIFGFGFTPKALVVFLFSVFPVIINVYEGASSVPERHIEVARSFRARETAMWRDVVIPYTLPFAMTGIRLAIARALIGMIAAEFFFSVSGLGELILVNSRRLNTAEVLATILVVCVIGVLLMIGGQRLESKFSAWRAAS